MDLAVSAVDSCLHSSFHTNPTTVVASSIPFFTRPTRTSSLPKGGGGTTPSSSSSHPCSGSRGRGLGLSGAVQASAPAHPVGGPCCRREGRRSERHHHAQPQPHTFTFPPSLVALPDRAGQAAVFPDLARPRCCSHVLFKVARLPGCRTKEGFRKCAHAADVFRDESAGVGRRCRPRPHLLHTRRPGEWEWGDHCFCRHVPPRYEGVAHGGSSRIRVPPSSSGSRMEQRDVIIVKF